MKKRNGNSRGTATRNMQLHQERISDRARKGTHRGQGTTPRPDLIYGRATGIPSGRSDAGEEPAATSTRTA